MLALLGIGGLALYIVFGKYAYADTLSELRATRIESAAPRTPVTRD